MKIKIIHHKEYFGQILPTFKSMDLDLLKTTFEKEKLLTSFISIEDLQHEEYEPDTFYVCSSHQNMDVKSYFDDVLDIPLLDNSLIPNRRLIKAHENKGYQGLLAKSKALKYVSQNYYIEPIDIKQKIVVKAVNGAGSGGVILCSNTGSLKRFIGKAKLIRIGIRRITYYLRAYINNLIKVPFHKEALEYYTPKEKYVTQNFIEDLDCDYKVLVFMNKCFVLKRGTRTNDFRASGSGKFEFIEPTNELLDFALDCRLKLDTPYVSLDVLIKDDNYMCIEYQCVHFGPYTQMNASKYYEKNQGDDWTEKKNDTILEILVAESVADYIQKYK